MILDKIIIIQLDILENKINFLFEEDLKNYFI